MGYNPENMPFSFFYDNGDLVGFDVELMHILAQELKVDLEFIPWNYKTVLKEYDLIVDVGIGGLIVTPERLTRLNFSNPYINITTAVVVKDYQRDKYRSWRTIDEEMVGRLGVVGITRAMDIKRYLPNADIVVMKSYSDFFKDNPNMVDAILISAEAGSAWTILYPFFLPECG